MKKHNPKLWLMCGQHINASDDNCTDLKGHSWTEYEYEAMKKEFHKKLAEDNKPLTIPSNLATNDEVV